LCIWRARYASYPTQFAGGEVHDAVRHQSVDKFVGRVHQLDDRRPALNEHRPPRVHDDARLTVGRRRRRWPALHGHGGLRELLVPRQILAHHVLLVGRRQRVAQLDEIRFRSELRHVIQYGADAIDATLFALCTQFDEL